MIRTVRTIRHTLIFTNGNGNKKKTQYLYQTRMIFSNRRTEQKFSSYEKIWKE